MKKIISGFVACALIMITIITMAPIAEAGSSPNYGYSYHPSPGLYYDGYVQCQPSYNDGGYHALRAYLRFWKDRPGGVMKDDTGRLYTAMGTGTNDGRILRRSYRYYDDPFYFSDTYKTQFRYNFEWVKHKSTDVSINSQQSEDE